jgi:hypothetical protein
MNSANIWRQFQELSIRLNGSHTKTMVGTVTGRETLLDERSENKTQLNRKLKSKHQAQTYSNFPSSFSITSVSFIRSNRSRFSSSVLLTKCLLLPLSNFCTSKNALSSSSSVVLATELRCLDMRFLRRRSFSRSIRFFCRLISAMTSTYMYVCSSSATRPMTCTYLIKHQNQ